MNPSKPKIIKPKNGHHLVALIAGGSVDAFHELRIKLAEKVGVIAQYHWEPDQVPGFDKSPPSDVDVCIIIKTYIGNQQYHVIELCKSVGLPYFLTSHKWATVVKLIRFHGYDTVGKSISPQELDSKWPLTMDGKLLVEKQLPDLLPDGPLPDLPLDEQPLPDLPPDLLLPPSRIPAAKTSLPPWSARRHADSVIGTLPSPSIDTVPTTVPIIPPAIGQFIRQLRQFLESSGVQGVMVTQHGCEIDWGTAQKDRS